MLPENVLYYGEEQPLPAQQSLRAGSLSLIFEAGDLRYIRWGEREILRRVYVAVRDRNWGTVPASLSNLRVESTGDTFRVSFDVEHRQGEVDFAWKGAIIGDAGGTVQFAMDGVARSTFLRNRIGFCVLHPIRECAGQPCEVEKTDGAVERGAFPKYISPHQPFMEMRAISHVVAPGLRAEVRFSGDTFEMEDQRNWTDASFKTYCTPLALPYPVEVREGERVSQSVTLSLKGAARSPSLEPQSSGVIFSLTGAAPVPLPRIGLGAASHGLPLSERELSRLQALNLSHLRVDLHLGEAEWAERLRQTTAEAAAVGVPLEAALHLTEAAAEELPALKAQVEAMRPVISTWLIFHVNEKSTTARWVELARKHLADYDPQAKLAAGTNAYFTELNRERPPAAMLDAVCYSINPQVHAFDNASLVETLEAQASTVESARQFAAGKPIRVSPVTLRARFNPNATGPEPEPPRGELPAAVDPRQMSLFGAGWTTGSLKYLAKSGVAAVTYYETTGWRGVMETEEGSPLPERFRSIPGAVFPLFHALADVGEFAGGEVLPTRSSSSLSIDGLTLRMAGKTRTLLANLRPEPQSVQVTDLPERVRLRLLDETNAEEAMQSPEAFRAREGDLVETRAGELSLELRPYAVVRIDSD